jgi:hypothetical protein
MIILVLIFICVQFYHIDVLCQNGNFYKVFFRRMLTLTILNTVATTLKLKLVLKNKLMMMTSSTLTVTLRAIITRTSLKPFLVAISIGR